MPFTEDPSRAAAAGEYSAQLNRLLAADRRGDAARLFLRQELVDALVVAGDIRLAPYSE